MKKIFIDGSVGTTGLRIRERLEGREDVTLITLPEEVRKDPEARRHALNSADIVFLCLPDDAAREAVSLLENESTVIIDASTAHRTSPGWAYGFPELSAAHRAALTASRRIAVPGCHASGYIALVYPLIEAGLIQKDADLSCFSLTGYSGGGKKMIAEYEAEGRSVLLDAPRVYALGQAHKHLAEMKHVTGMESAPVFSPVVGDFYSGMLVTVPLTAKQVKGGIAAAREVLMQKYRGGIVTYVEDFAEAGFAAANALGGKDTMQVTVYGNEERFTLCALYDNLGKGASGAAIECMNIVMGEDPTCGLVL